MARLVLHLKRVLSRARRIGSRPGEVQLTLPSVVFTGSPAHTDDALLNLLWGASDRDDIAAWLQKGQTPAESPESLYRDRRALGRIDSVIRLTRACVSSEGSAAFAVLLDAVGDAIREFREFERATGVYIYRRVIPEGAAWSRWMDGMEIMHHHVSSVVTELRLFQASFTGEATLLPRGARWHPRAYAVFQPSAEEGRDDGDSTINILAFLAANQNHWPFPYSERANTAPRERPSAEAAEAIQRRLEDRWIQIVGARLGEITRPVRLSGDKLRRLVVEADYSVYPPWGNWTSFSRGADRQAFTEMRRAVNECVSPHEIDHIDFVPW